MGTRLDEMFTALQTDADMTPMPEDLRGRVRMAAAGSALAVVAVLTVPFLHSGLPQAAPEAPAVVLPSVIPDSAFLQPVETGESWFPEESEVAMLPPPCGRAPGVAEMAGMYRQVHVIYREAGASGRADTSSRRFCSSRTTTGRDG